MHAAAVFLFQSPRFDAGSPALAKRPGSIRWPRQIGSIAWPPRPTDGSSHMMYQNRLSLIGFTGKDAEQKVTQNGIAYTLLSVATKTSWKDKESGAWQSRSEWHRVVVIWNWTVSQARFSFEASLSVDFGL